MTYRIITDDVIDEMLDEIRLIKLDTYFGEFSE